MTDLAALKTCVTRKHHRELHGADRCGHAIVPEFDPVRGCQIFQAGSYCHEQRAPGIGAWLGRRCGPNGKFHKPKDEAEL
jgi:hypothetical protein